MSGGTLTVSTNHVILTTFNHTHHFLQVTSLWSLFLQMCSGYISPLTYLTLQEKEGGFFVCDTVHCTAWLANFTAFVMLGSTAFTTSCYTSDLKIVTVQEKEKRRYCRGGSWGITHRLWNAKIIHYHESVSFEINKGLRWGSAQKPLSAVWFREVSETLRVTA